LTYRIVLPALVCGSLLGQAPPPKPDFTPDTVLAIIDGHKLTYGEIETYLDGLGPERKTRALASMLSRKSWSSLLRRKSWIKKALIKKRWK